jgi:hypothetical protein
MINDEKNQKETERENDLMKRNLKIVMVLVMAVVLITPILSACGGSSSPVGLWSEGRQEMEFFSDGTLIVRSGGTREVIANWRTDGNRMSITIEGLQDVAVRHLSWNPSGSWDFDISNNVLTLDNGGRVRELERIN